ncbi:hypothetical protein BO94DRAFT_535605 [Aspergillus sclerotioniger CBS 115572]|uniref:Uncharacterized protein n=1 Tax=Aspergillus sclerotioniger CBS 115572 TaxID=1450535 RepID=A0A317WJ14_9EURO|nr:hypothetical protein BO94DRAFT_535605 [Aspergillus sclerotioniger CBS 115572]PWY86446.1 hypothetical protein BO94DRAFT_535605 [Aspergillus sclerotioniger CBS 115572]
MINPLQYEVATGLLASLLVQQGLSLELAAFNPSTSSATQAKVAVAGSAAESMDYSSIDLRTSHSFYWGASSGSGYTLGNLTLTDESVLPMETFSDLLHTIQCTNSSMHLVFADSDAYSYAKNSWSWVNDASNRTFLMVAGVNQCSWNTQRVPFVITSASFHDNSTAAMLTGNSATWDDVLNNHELTIGKAPSDMEVALSKRISGTKTGSISVEKTMSDKSVKLLSNDDLTLSAECKSCGTSGSLDLSFKYKVTTAKSGIFGSIGSVLEDKWKVDTAELTVTPSDLAVDITPALELSGNLTKSYTKEYDFDALTLEGIHIPDVFTLDVNLEFGIGATAGPVNGDASISYPMKVSISDDAEAVFQIVDEKITKKDWTPTITTSGVQLSAEIDATLEAYIKASLELTLSVGKSWGYEAGIYLKPFLSADFTAEASTTGTCSDTSKNYHYAIEVAPSAGIELGADVAKVSDQGNPLADVTLASYTKAMSTTCIGFDSITSTKTTTSEKTTSTSESKSTESDNTTESKKTSTETKSTTKTKSTSTKSSPSSASASATAHFSTHASSTHASTTPNSCGTTKASSSYVAASSSAHYSAHNHARGFRHHGGF